MNINFGCSFHLAVAFAALVAAFVVVPDAQASADLGKDNAALVQHIKATDFVFRSVLGECKGEHIVRVRRNGVRYFTYSAICTINPRPDEDCGHYKVRATGTIDTPENATVRDTRLVLLCSG